MLEMKMINPFGVLLEKPQNFGSIGDIPALEIMEILNDHKLIVMRGFPALSSIDFIKYAKQYGPLLRWKFGEILNLKIENKPANHLFSSGRVEMHWDGAYLNEAPRFSIFQCLESSGESEDGETIFLDTISHLECSSESDVNTWSKISINYKSEKAAHYGGDINSPLIGVHPHSGKYNIRFIEPFNEDSIDVNPVNLTVSGLELLEENVFLRGIIDNIYSSKFIYRHNWIKGDFLIYDNDALLHGRGRINSNVNRHLQRVHILNGLESDPDRDAVFVGERSKDIHL